MSTLLIWGLSPVKGCMCDTQRIRYRHRGETHSHVSAQSQKCTVPKQGVTGRDLRACFVTHAVLRQEQLYLEHPWQVFYTTYPKKWHDSLLRLLCEF